jgi:hypothetical protein
MSGPVNGPRDGTPDTPLRAPGDPPATPTETCDLCGSASVEWRSCKLICLNCRAIVRSCSDL